MLDDDTFYDKYIKDDFESQYVPLVFEIICKEYLINKNKKLEINPMLTDIGMIILLKKKMDNLML